MLHLTERAPDCTQAAGKPEQACSSCCIQDTNIANAECYHKDDILIQWFHGAKSTAHRMHNLVFCGISSHQHALVSCFCGLPKAWCFFNLLITRKAVLHPYKPSVYPRLESQS